MSRKIKRSALVPAILLAYLAVMAWVGFDNLRAGRLSLATYVATIVVTLGVIYLLHLFLKKRDRLRAERLAGLEKRVAADKAGGDSPRL